MSLTVQDAGHFFIAFTFEMIHDYALLVNDTAKERHGRNMKLALLPCYRAGFPRDGPKPF